MGALMNIDLKEFYHKRTITRDDGKIIADLILEKWKTENKITIDFSNILIASVSFMDEAFGKLAFEFSLKELQNKLSFVNIEQYDRALLNDILISRYRQKEVGENGKSSRDKKKIIRPKQ